MPVPAYRVELTPFADRQLRKLDLLARRQVEALLARLVDDPRPPGVVALVGQPGRLRARTGDYRVVYEVHDQALHVAVITVAHRRDVYRQH